ARLLLSSGADALTRDLAQLAWLLPALALGWFLSFCILFAIGALAFFLERSSAIVDVYFGVFAVLSGYLVPLTIMPAWLAAVAQVTPFRGIIGIPVQIVTDPSLGPMGAARLVGFQALWAVAVLLLLSWLWRRGVRRFEAFGA
ncbi:MAG TPA: ABC-2 family transporter protein, partial [Kofleriaceae bacterium]|nr:ABC-2 family transporter protein [Kofleriaceae bacterium]